MAKVRYDRKYIFYDKRYAHCATDYDVGGWTSPLILVQYLARKNIRVKKSKRVFAGGLPVLRGKSNLLACTKTKYSRVVNPLGEDKNISLREKKIYCTV